jgi:hypothetical protein
MFPFMLVDRYDVSEEHPASVLRVEELGHRRQNSSAELVLVEFGSCSGECLSGLGLYIAPVGVRLPYMKARSMFGLLFYPGDGGSTFLRNVGKDARKVHGLMSQKLSRCAASRDLVELKRD